MKIEKIVAFSKRKFQKKAISLAQNADDIFSIIARAKRKIDRSDKLLVEIVDDLKTLLRLLSCYFKGEYREIDKSSIVLIIISILYFLMPLDLLPDFIPLTGYVDDVALILWLINQIGTEFLKFKKWESQTSEDVI